MLEDETVPSGLFQTTRIIEKSGKSNLIVFIGQPLNESFLVSAISRMAVNQKVELVEVVVGE